MGVSRESTSHIFQVVTLSKWQCIEFSLNFLLLEAKKKARLVSSYIHSCLVLSCFTLLGVVIRWINHPGVVIRWINHPCVVIRWMLPLHTYFARSFVFLIEEFFVSSVESFSKWILCWMPGITSAALWRLIKGWVKYNTPPLPLLIQKYTESANIRLPK